jgi:hypothetical protein
VVAIATDAYLKPKYPFADTVELPMVAAPKYGQDLTSGFGRAAPHKQSVGKTPEVLRPKMQKLLTIFAAGDKSGMARRLFDTFLAGHSSVTLFSDAALDLAAAGHPHIESFCQAAMAIPGPPPVIWGRGGGRNAGQAPPARRCDSLPF